MCHWCTEHAGRGERWYTTYENFLFNKIFPTAEEQEEAKKKIVATFADTEWRYSQPQYIRNKEFLINRTQSGFGSQIITREETKRILTLLEAQTYRQAMYTSCGFFFEDLSRLEPRYIIAYAAKAIQLIKEATGISLEEGFKLDLRPAVSWITDQTGEEIYEDVAQGRF